MENQISLKLDNYERDFLLFQLELSKLREIAPNKFIAFKEGRIISSANSMDELLSELDIQCINPSETVIEFVSRKEIKVIV